MTFKIHSSLDKKYPYALCDNAGAALMLIKNEEITVNNERISVEISDVIEREMWDLSTQRLRELKQEIVKDKVLDEHIIKGFIQRIDKILQQRSFIKYNVAFRMALNPEE